MESAFVIIVFVIVALGILGALQQMLNAGTSSLPIQRQTVLTQNERHFVEKLADALEDVPGVTLLPQVSMGAFLKVTPGTPKKLAAITRNRFLQKRCDFILVDDHTNVLLIIELDDRSHNADKDRKRDALGSAAGITTVRFPSARKATAESIRERLAPYLPSAA